MDWPLVGREAELERVATRLREAAGALVLAGPAGVGKTRLAEEAVRAAAGPGLVVEGVSATASSSQIPFGALSHLLPPPARAPADRFELLQHARRSLLSRASGERLLLTVDDAHLLDDGSATLVHQLARSGEATLLVTVRSGEPAPDPIVALWKDRLAERHELTPLDHRAVESLVRTALDGPVTRGAVERLWELSEGNPLYLRELVQGGLDSSTLVLEDGAWRLTGPLAPSLWLTEIIDARLRRLGPRERDAAETLAVGQPLGLDVLEQVVGPEAVEALERARVVRTHAEGRRVQVRLVHPVYGEVLRAELPRSRSRRLAGRLADAVTDRGGLRGEDLLRVASWRLDAGGPYDPELLTAAAGRALSMFDYELAERLATAAVDSGGHGFEARLALGKAIAWQHRRSEEADRHLQAAAGEAGDDAQRARAALARARSLFFRARRPQEAMDVATAASAAVADEDWRDELEAMVALFASLLGDLRRAAAAGQRIKQRPAPAARPLRATLAVTTFSEVLLGRFDDAAESIRLGLATTEDATDSPLLAADLFGCYQAMLDAYAGRVEAAERAARAGFAGARQERVDAAGPWGDVLCHVLILRGKAAAAAEAGQATAALVHERDPFGVAGMTLGGWAYAAALRRDEATVEGLLDRLEHSPIPDPRPGIFADLARARLAASRGDVTGGAQLAATAAARAVDGSHLVWGSFLLHEAVRLGRPRQVLVALREVAGEVEGELIPMFLAHAEALDARDGERLDAVASRFAEMGAVLHAAEAAGQAAAHRRAQRARAARRAAARTEGWAALCEGAWAPDLAAPAEALTQREREVALLATRGLTSRQIAERLVVSPRTVDNHLRSAYRKLGVAGRADLPSVLAPG